MKIEIDLSKIENGILVLNIPDTNKTIHQDFDSAKMSKSNNADFVSELKQYFTTAELISAVKKYRKTLDNSFLSKELISKGYIQPLKKARCYIPGPNWDISMGKTKILCSSHKNMNGVAVISRYNKNHPVIKQIIKNILTRE